MKNIPIMLSLSLIMMSLTSSPMRASTVHVINTSKDMVRVFFRGQESPHTTVEVLPAKTASIYRVEKELISHKPVFQAIGASCYGGGPDWNLLSPHCGTLHKDKNYVIQIEDDGMGSLKTSCTELATAI